MEQYINKDDLVAEIEKLIANGKEKCQQSKEKNAPGSYIAWSEHIATCGKILSYINTLEVKEVDLETAFAALIDHFDEKNNYGQWPESDLKDFAKHFFELGIKYRKGE